MKPVLVNASLHGLAALLALLLAVTLAALLLKLVSCSPIPLD